MKLAPDTRYAALLSAAAGALLASSAHAAITWSGVLDLAITTNFDGIYLDLDAGGSTASTPYPDTPGTGSYTIGYTQPADWDANFFFGGIGIAYSETFQPFVDDTVGNRSPILNVTPGTVISSEATARTLGVPGIGGSGTSNGVPGRSHFDTPTVDTNPAYSGFSPGSQGYIAFVLNPGASEQYGWMRVTLTNNGTPGVIHEWAFSDESTFEVGQIPEPASLVMLVAGAGILLRRTRRQGT